MDPYNLQVTVLAVMAVMLLARIPLGMAAKAVMFAALGFLVLGGIIGILDVGTGVQAFYRLPPLDGAAASSSRIYMLSAWVAFSIAGLVMATVVASWHGLREWRVMLAALLLGLASVAAMGFSPTAYASGSRIYFVCQMVLLLVALRLFAGVEREFGMRVARVTLVVVSAAAGYRILHLLGWLEIFGGGDHEILGAASVCVA